MTEVTALWSKTGLFHLVTTPTNLRSQAAVQKSWSVTCKLFYGIITAICQVSNAKYLNGESQSITKVPRDCLGSVVIHPPYLAVQDLCRLLVKYPDGQDVTGKVAKDFADFNNISCLFNIAWWHSRIPFDSPFKLFTSPVFQFGWLQADF